MQDKVEGGVAVRRVVVVGSAVVGLLYGSTLLTRGRAEGSWQAPSVPVAEKASTTRVASLGSRAPVPDSSINEAAVVAEAPLPVSAASEPTPAPEPIPNALPIGAKATHPRPSRSAPPPRFVRHVTHAPAPRQPARAGGALLAKTEPIQFQLAARSNAL